MWWAALYSKTPVFDEGLCYSGVIGGATGARTPDLLHAMQMLFQLSYRPKFDARTERLLSIEIDYGAYGAYENGRLTDCVRTLWSHAKSLDRQLQCYRKPA